MITFIIVLCILYIVVITSIVWKKDGKKSGILMSLLLISFIALFLVPIIIEENNNNYGMEDEIEYLEERVSRNQTYKDKYQIETFRLMDGRLLVKLFNERDEYVKADFFAKFYDNGKEISVPNYGYIFLIPPHSYGYGFLHDYPRSNKSYKNYVNDEINVYITPRKYEKENFKDSIEYAYNQEEQIIYGVNNSDKNIGELYFDIIYYDDNGKIIDYDYIDNRYAVYFNNQFTIKYDSKYKNVDVILRYAKEKNN